MSDFLKDLKKIYNPSKASEQPVVYKVGDVIQVSPSVFGVRSSASSITVEILEVYKNGNLRVKAVDSQIEKAVYPSQIRNS